MLLFCAINGFGKNFIVHGDKRFMAALTIQKRTLIVQLYFQNNNSVTWTQRAFRRINGPAYTPSLHTVRGIINKFWELGTTHNRHRSGRPRHSRSLENIESVTQDVLSSSNKSVKRLSVQFQIHNLEKKAYIVFHTKLPLFNILILRL